MVSLTSFLNKYIDHSWNIFRGTLDLYKFEGNLTRIWSYLLIRSDREMLSIDKGIHAIAFVKPLIGIAKRIHSFGIFHYLGIIKALIFFWMCNELLICSFPLYQLNLTSNDSCNYRIQLRNLVWATSKHDVYFMSNYSVMHWSSLMGNLTDVLNFSGHVKPTEVTKKPLLSAFVTDVKTLMVIFSFELYPYSFCPSFKVL